MDRRQRGFVMALAAALPLVLLALPACRSMRHDPEYPGLRVRPPVAFEMLLDAPYMPILDLRRPEEFAGPLGHIKGARNLPLEALPARLAELDWMKGLTFLVVCRGSDDCGEKAMRIFIEDAFFDAVLLEGGVEAWRRDGYATVEAGTYEAEPKEPEGSEFRIPENPQGGAGKRGLPKPP